MSELTAGGDSVAGAGENFGNARGARNLVGEMITNHANRVAGADLSDSSVLVTLTAEDV